MEFADFQQAFESLNDAKAGFYDLLGISRDDSLNPSERVVCPIYYQVPARSDGLPNPYPEVIDLRNRKWRLVLKAIFSKVEVHVQKSLDQELSDENMLRFTMMRSWQALETYDEDDFHVFICADQQNGHSDWLSSDESIASKRNSDFALLLGVKQRVYQHQNYGFLDSTLATSQVHERQIINEIYGQQKVLTIQNLDEFLDKFPAESTVKPSEVLKSLREIIEGETYYSFIVPINDKTKAQFSLINNRVKSNSIPELEIFDYRFIHFITPGQEDLMASF